MRRFKVHAAGMAGGELKLDSERAFPMLGARAEAARGGAAPVAGANAWAALADNSDSEGDGGGAAGGGGGSETAAASATSGSAAGGAAPADAAAAPARALKGPRAPGGGSSSGGGGGGEGGPTGPPLSDDEFEKVCGHVLNELMATFNVDAAATSLGNTHVDPSKRAAFATRVLVIAAECTDEERSALQKVLPRLVESRALSKEALRAGVLVAMEQLGDLVMDSPKTPEYWGAMLKGLVLRNVSLAVLVLGDLWAVS